MYKRVALPDMLGDPGLMFLAWWLKMFVVFCVPWGVDCKPVLENGWLPSFLLKLLCLEKSVLQGE